MAVVKEKHIQQNIRLAIGSQDDVLCFRNSVGVAHYEKNGRTFSVPYGLCKGSSDLVGLAYGGRFFALEVKRPGGRLSKEQKQFITLTRRYGGFACRVDSVEEAVDAMARLRSGSVE